jgi:hypothetical protein
LYPGLDTPNVNELLSIDSIPISSLVEKINDTLTTSISNLQNEVEGTKANIKQLEKRINTIGNELCSIDGNLKLVVQPLNTHPHGERAKTDWLGIRIMCPSEATCLPTDCCFSELPL